METPHLTEDEMADIKKEVLERLRPYLCDKIIADRHFDFLRSRKVLTKEDTEEISCRTTHRKKTSKLLDYLAENPRGLDTLVESIQHSRASAFIIAKITDEVQSVKNERIQALKAGMVCSGYLHPTKYSSAPNDLSRTLSDESNFEKVCESTLPFHRDSDYGSSCFETQPFNLPSSHSSAYILSVSTLPKPGDPGAPPLPDELPVESEEASAGTSSGAPFQPLRSRSMTPPYQSTSGPSA